MLEEDSSDGEKVVSLQKMPLKSSDNWNGKHIEGLDEYEERLRKELAVEGAGETFSGLSGNNDGVSSTNRTKANRGSRKTYGGLTTREEK